MRNFNYESLKELSFDLKMVRLLNNIHEAKGRCEAYLSKKPQELERLVEIAKIQSVDASNAIEGIRTTETRLKQLIRQKTTPKNRNEEEISGYRDALNVIHDSFEYISLTPGYILQLHKIMFSHVSNASFGGMFKNTQNYIQGIDENGEATTIFTPLSPFETPAAIEEICNQYNKMIKEGEIDPLILIPVFIHDFLCIHPFRDGNGRMSRLLTTLLLYRSGYFIGRYISLEAIIAPIKDLYYDALAESQVGWYDNQDDPLPFIKYILSIVDMAYKGFESRLELVNDKTSAKETVEMAVERKIGKFTKSDIMELCPGLSASAVEKGLSILLKDEKIIKYGGGRTTFYVKKN
ncbi:MAG: Fic family protein [Erysipelotrichaceae bacterium]|nr:Fic family protein [Erysipelotrichaceae bacterium]